MEITSGTLVRVLGYKLCGIICHKDTGPMGVQRVGRLLGHPTMAGLCPGKSQNRAYLYTGYILRVLEHKFYYQMSHKDPESV